MKRYKFKLEGLLKIRRAKEQLCKTQIGQLQGEVVRCEESIEFEKQGILKASSAQNRILEQKALGREVGFFPRFIQGKEANIELLYQRIRYLKEQIQFKYEELYKLRADVKVIEKLREKDFNKYKKEVNKKLELEREENLMMWSQYNTEEL
jgi:flagellar FliJ protein